MKRAHVAATLVALALALPSCGGGDSQDTSTTAAGTSEPAQPGQAQSAPQEGSERSKDAARKKSPNGNGGSSAADAERAAAGGNSDKGSAPPAKNSKPAKQLTPAQRVAGLSPAERRALHKDLYEQGKRLCYSYGPEQLAKDYNITSTDPATVAERYARLYEEATPTLILPYQQGCLAGFRKWERNPPKNPGS